MKTLIVIQGPTGVGKTNLSLEVAEHFGVPIINADSRQIYAEIPIGTAAPTAEQQKRVKHYFVGTRHIDEYYSASMFESEVLSLLDQLFASSDVALMCGGSMMYIDAVCKGIDDIPTVDSKTRDSLKNRFLEEGLERLVDELQQLDYEYWKIVDRNNPRRVVHALEICHMTGKSYTSFRNKTAKPRPFAIIKIGLTAERSVLYGNIDDRVDKMIDCGLYDEALSVYPFKGVNALNTVGYKEMFSHIEGKSSFEEAIYKIKCNTHRYCRKQLTWLRSDDLLQWFGPNDVAQIINFIESRLC